MEPRRDETDLAAELRALRPAPRPEFAAALDARAAAGFPPAPGRGRTGGSRARRLLRAVPARHLPTLAGACALAAIAVATAVVVSSENGGPASTTRGTQPGGSLLSETTGTAARPKAESGVASAGVAEAGGAAQLAPHRDVERGAQIVLATGASEVHDAAAKVFETVQAYHGIVMRSSIRDGGSEAGASFDLLIPSGRLSEAMGAFSAIAAVRSRSESSADVTAPISRLAERLHDAQARVESLLAQLTGPGTEAERQALEAKLHAARGRVAALRGSLAALQRRTHLSEVSLRIEADGNAGKSGGWGIGRAFGDAGHILSVAAGVTVIGLALLLPLALLCLLAWLARRTWIRRDRDRALG